jgi:hypothetical protein
VNGSCHARSEVFDYFQSLSASGGPFWNL